jgi:hypothetical protein
MAFLAARRRCNLVVASDDGLRVEAIDDEDCSHALKVLHESKSNCSTYKLASSGDSTASKTRVSPAPENEQLGSIHDGRKTRLEHR